MMIAGAMVGDWCVVEPIARGGMSAVYEVRHRVHGNPAALKVMSTEAAASPHAIERFALEGRVLNDLGHRGIPEIFELGALSDGRPFLAMELLHGRTLGSLIERCRPERDVALEVVAQLCDVLMSAHRHGVVHRDLKPDNVLLLDGDEPVVKLLDWGIAKLLAVPESGTATTAGTVVGTPRYLSPEQARAQPIDPSTDVYALGLVAYELVLGAFPFEANSLGEMMMMHMVTPPPAPRRYWPDIPVTLERTLLAMLAKDPALRPTMAEVHAAIRGDAPAPPPPPHVESSSGDRPTARCRKLQRA